MKVEELSLAWIVVDDFEKAIKFYTEVVGLTLKNTDSEYGWAELSGVQGGMRLGISKSHMGYKAGMNAVVTFRVKNIEDAVASLVKKGAKLIGDIIEVPGHVKMQTVEDEDLNHFQIVEMIEIED